MTVVIDASISASWLLPDEENELGRQILLDLGRSPAFVPSIWDYEIHNILIINERRGRITREAADAAIGFLSSLNMIRDRATNWTRGTELAREFTLTAYDAAYLELAVRLDLPLATLDKALMSVAGKMNRLAVAAPKP